jgi:hypothetical protein
MLEFGGEPMLSLKYKSTPGGAQPLLSGRSPAIDLLLYAEQP